MKLSIFHHHLVAAAKELRITQEESYLLAKEMGISAVDINLDDLTADPTLPTRAANCGLAISSIHAYYRFCEREESTRIALHMETAVAVGAKCVMVIPDFFPAGEIPASVIHKYGSCAAFFDASPRMKNILSGMREAVRVGREHGITVTVEDYDHADSPTATSTEMRYFAERVPGLAFTFDTGNFAFSDEDALAALDRLTDRTVYLHCKDRGEEEGHRGIRTRGLAACAVGDGYLPIGEILRRLQNAGYDGYVAIEHFGVPCYREASARSVEFLLPYIK